jgi:hypothetical protein
MVIMKNSAIPFSIEMQELFLEAPVLIALAAAERDRKKKEEFKRMAHQLFFAKTTDGYEELEAKLNQAEPFFDETFKRIDRVLPADLGAKNTTIVLWISEIVNNEHSLPSDEMIRWRERLLKYGSFLTGSGEEVSDKNIEPLRTIIQQQNGEIDWETLLHFYN